MSSARSSDADGGTVALARNAAIRSDRGVLFLSPVCLVALSGRGGPALAIRKTNSFPDQTMRSRILILRRVAAVLATTAAMTLALAPAAAMSQGSGGSSFRVLIDGAVAGSATAAANLPTQAVVMTQDSNPNLPAAQVAASGQGSVILTTADPALIAAIQAWMKADNSGFKDTVQRKTVEIDRVMGSGPTTRYRLSDAWPSKLDTATGNTAITIVYQRLALIP
jgi:hypothetical protein